MSKEKIYHQSEGIVVTSSRVTFPETSTDYVLRNISSVSVGGNGLRAIGLVYGVILGLCGIFAFVFGAAMIGIILIVIAGLCLLLKDKYAVVVVSGGGDPKRHLSFKNKEDCNTIVKQINNAILDIDKNRNSEPKSKSESNSNSLSLDEIRKLKDLLDDGVITEEEFQEKKKDLLKKM